MIASQNHGIANFRFTKEHLSTSIIEFFQESWYNRGNTNPIVTLKIFSVFQVGDPENRRPPVP